MARFIYSWRECSRSPYLGGLGPSYLSSVSGNSKAGLAARLVLSSCSFRRAASLFLPPPRSIAQNIEYVVVAIYDLT